MRWLEKSNCDDDPLSLERRTDEDRRSEFSPTNFPVYTETGSWVRKERRNKPERSLQNIDVKENEILEEEFKELFKEYS